MGSRVGFRNWLAGLVRSAGRNSRRAWLGTVSSRVRVELWFRFFALERIEVVEFECRGGSTLRKRDPARDSFVPEQPPWHRPSALIPRLRDALGDGTCTSNVRRCRQSPFQHNQDVYIGNKLYNAYPVVFSPSLCFSPCVSLVLAWILCTVERGWLVSGTSSFSGGGAPVQPIARAIPVRPGVSSAFSANSSIPT